MGAAGKRQTTQSVLVPATRLCVGVKAGGLQGLRLIVVGLATARMETCGGLSTSQAIPLGAHKQF